MIVITSLGVTSKSFRRNEKGKKDQFTSLCIDFATRLSEIRLTISRSPHCRTWCRCPPWRRATTKSGASQRLCPTFLTVCVVFFATLAARFDVPAQTVSIETATAAQTATCSYHADFCPDHVCFRGRGYATHAEL